MHVFKITERMHKKFFDFPIRKKRDSIVLLINLCDYLLNFSKISDSEKIISNMYIKNNNGYRLFYEESDKTYTLCSPFRFYVTDDNIEITNSLLGTIGNPEISLLKRIFITEKLYSLNDAVDSYCLIETIIHEDFNSISITPQEMWSFLISFISYESGYLRYDYDPKNSKGKIHPLYHLDIFYTNYSTFKFGIKKAMPIKDFINMFDSETDQLYLI